MSFLRIDNSTRKNLPNAIAKKASTAMNPGDVVIGTSGQVDVAVAASVLLLGIATQKIASTDADYASTTAVVVEQIDPTAVYRTTVSTGTLLASMINTQVDLEDANSINVNGTTYKQVKIVGVIDTTTALVTFNPNLL